MANVRGRSLIVRFGVCVLSSSTPSNSKHININVVPPATVLTFLKLAALILTTIICPVRKRNGGESDGDWQRLGWRNMQR